MSEASNKAKRKYSITHKDEYRLIHIRLNKKNDSDIIKKIDSVGNMQGYIKSLVRKDIDGEK